jgi:hypothetical protein
LEFAKTRRPVTILAASSYDKNSESDYFFSSTKIRIFFFSNIGNQNIFLEKKQNPPFKLNGRSLTEIKIFKLIGPI